MPSGYYKADLISHFQSEITVKLSVLRFFFFLIIITPYVFGRLFWFLLPNVQYKKSDDCCYSVYEIIS